MINAIVFDADGMVVRSDAVFSERYSREFGIPIETMLTFFHGAFQRCLVGKSDLKEELKTIAPKWGWNKSIDTLLEYWFSAERKTDARILESADQLRSKGIKCCLSTNNESYRTNDLLSIVGLNAHFDQIFSSADIGHKKPERQYWDTVVDRVGLVPHDILVWDDDSVNVASARKYGFAAELYSDFETFRDTLKKYVNV